MRKKVALLLFFIFGVTMLGPFLALNRSEAAAYECATEAECLQLLQNVNVELEGLHRQDQGLQTDIMNLMGRIEQTQQDILQSEAEIVAVQENIREVEVSIRELEAEIAAKEASILEGENELEHINLEIGNLSELVGERMQATQRNRFTNVWLELLGQSPDLLSLVRNMVLLSNLAEHDTRTMEHLSDLMEQQEILLAQLAAQHLSLSESRNALVFQQGDLIAERQVLEAKQAHFIELQEDLTNQQRILGAERENLRSGINMAENAATMANSQLYHFERLRQEAQRIAEEEAAAAAAAANPPATDLAESPAPSAPAAPPASGMPAQPPAASAVPTPPPAAPAAPVAPAPVAPPVNTGGGSNWIIPLERGQVTCEFGCYTVPFFHNGIDLGNFGDTSTRVLAAADGIVTTAGWHNMFGNHVIMVHDINGQMYTTVYAHLHQHPFVSVGQFVSQGTALGTMGNTGFSFGAHLHFEIYRGPMNWPHSFNPRDIIHFPASW